MRKNKQDWKLWCPQNEDQTFRMGKKEAFCQVAKYPHRGMLIWGDTVINFKEPSWKMRYRYAKPGQEQEMIPSLMAVKLAPVSSGPIRLSRLAGYNRRHLIAGYRYLSRY